MSEKKEYQLLTRDFARKDGIARVTGCDLARALHSFGAARENAEGVLVTRPRRSG